MPHARSPGLGIPPLRGFENENGIVRLALTARETWQHLDDTWQETDEKIDLGTAVRVSLARGRRRKHMTNEAVVIEIVPPGAMPVSCRVYCRCRSPVTRYVVQCWACRVIRPAAAMVVISL